MLVGITHVQSIGEKTSEGTHELSLELESLSCVNESLFVHIELGPGLIKLVVEVLLSVLLGEVVPLHYYVLTSFESLILS